MSRVTERFTTFDRCSMLLGHQSIVTVFATKVELVLFLLKIELFPTNGANYIGCFSRMFLSKKCKFMDFLCISSKLVRPQIHYKMGSLERFYKQKIFLLAFARFIYVHLENYHVLCFRAKQIPIPVFNGQIYGFFL